jgi:nitrogen fixation protein FixH
MTNFSLSASKCATQDDSLRSEITEHTGNDTETSGILRSIERFGGDASIERFEISRSERGRYAARTAASAWIVRAVRADAPQKS